MKTPSRLHHNILITAAIIISFFLIPMQIRERMRLWPEERRIGDIFVKFSPFFKMYTEYVKNFDNAISNINNYYAKNSKFAAIMDEIHVRARFYDLIATNMTDRTSDFFSRCLNAATSPSNTTC